MKISNTPFTVFDFETTGLFPYSGDRICEIGAVRGYPGKKTIKKFHSLVNPRRPISPNAFSVNGITDTMVKNKPTIDEVLPDFMEFVDGSILVAYNAGFDLGFLECALDDKASDLTNYFVVDALSLARKLFPGIGKYALHSVADSLGIKIDGQHRALADALTTWMVFNAQVELLTTRGVDDVKEIATAAPGARRPDRTHVKDRASPLIEDAIASQKKLRITYRSSWNNAVSNRTITPKRIQRGYDRSYVVAYCHLRNDERNFRLDCIVTAQTC